MSLIIPQDYTEFLHWVKEKTEAFWNVDSDENSSEFVCDDWIRGAKWIGMTEDEIEAIEFKYHIKFTDHHKKFLKILHTINRKQTVFDGTLDEKGHLIPKEVSLFYNWYADEEKIIEHLNKPFDLLREEVINDTVWLDSWGEKPENNEDKQHIFSTWFNNAPKLIPVSLNTFAISKPVNTDNPILLVLGRNTSIKGGNIKHYLLQELDEALGLLEYVYDETDEGWYEEPKEELTAVYDAEYDALKTKEIPYWKEFLLANGFNDYLAK